MKSSPFYSIKSLRQERSSLTATSFCFKQCTAMLNELERYLFNAFFSVVLSDLRPKDWQPAFHSTVYILVNTDFALEGKTRWDMLDGKSIYYCVQSSKGRKRQNEREKRREIKLYVQGHSENVCHSRELNSHLFCSSSAPFLQAAFLNALCFLFLLKREKKKREKEILHGL